MSTTPIFDTLLEQYPGIHRASPVFPQPAPEPHISFIRERGFLEVLQDIGHPAFKKGSILTNWVKP